MNIRFCPICEEKLTTNHDIDGTIIGNYCNNGHYNFDDLSLSYMVNGEILTMYTGNEESCKRDNEKLEVMVKDAKGNWDLHRRG